MKTAACVSKRGSTWCTEIVSSECLDREIENFTAAVEEKFSTLAESEEPLNDHHAATYGP